MSPFPNIHRRAFLKQASYGFGAAALSLAPRFHATLWSADGLPTLGSAIDIRLTFSPPTGR